MAMRIYFVMEPDSGIRDLVLQLHHYAPGTRQWNKRTRYCNYIIMHMFGSARLTTAAVPSYGGITFWLSQRLAFEDLLF
ncbi:hypothetical protein Pyn_39155 [Prunus yedoensis var. nudiflora]|uniref:Uncharacterized protein n=1 Tax=Prunus yedoensis var. nudiflora TaxID=2094558 RepID=A0A314UZG4_PRUYE|nr:hypothetical protein Pyn_39155 [Prunus yedoensis var. nudiflora]